MSGIRNRFVISVLKQVHFSSQLASNHLLWKVPHPFFNPVINCQVSQVYAILLFNSEHHFKRFEQSKCKVTLGMLHLCESGHFIIIQSDSEFQLNQQPPLEPQSCKSPLFFPPPFIQKLHIIAIQYPTVTKGNSHLLNLQFKVALLINTLVISCIFQTGGQSP